MHVDGMLAIELGSSCSLQILWLWPSLKKKNLSFFKAIGVILIRSYLSVLFLQIFFFFKHCTVCTLLFGPAIITCSQVAINGC